MLKLKSSLPCHVTVLQMVGIREVDDCSLGYYNLALPETIDYLQHKMWPTIAIWLPTNLGIVYIWIHTLIPNSFSSLSSNDNRFGEFINAVPAIEKSWSIIPTEGILEI